VSPVEFFESTIVPLGDEGEQLLVRRIIHLEGRPCRC
jgi:hypothetical protein